MRVFVDTWGWLTLEDHKETKHEEVATLVRESLKRPGLLVTSDHVLDEVITRLFRRRPFEESWLFTEGLLKSAGRGSVVLERVNEERFEDAIALRKTLSDKPRISFTDLTSMVIMRELKILTVVTADEHFRQAGLGFRLLPD